MEQPVAILENEPVGFDLTDGRDELNLAEFPLFHLGQRVPTEQKTLNYETQVYDQARNRTFSRKLEITASDAYGLPTVRDADVLLALLLMGKEANRLESATIHFSRYELAQVLGWDDSGATYKRISDALFKWLGVTLRFEKSFWDKGQQRWRTVGFHILEAVEINDAAGRGRKGELPFSSCRFSDEFFGSLVNGNLKKLNLADYFHLKVPAAKQMYRFLDKRFYHQTKLDFDLRTFACEHVGLSKNYAPRKLKEKLQPGIQELEDLGFIKAVAPALRYSKVGHGEYRVHFERGKRQIMPKPLSGNKGERSINRQLVNELTERGVTASVARELVEDRSIGEARIREKMELLDWLLGNKNCLPPRRPGGWLVKAIRDDFMPPKDFETAAQRAEKQLQRELFKKECNDRQRLRDEAEQRRRDAELLKLRDEWTAVEAFLASLPVEEREELIEAAIANPANSICRKYARRYREAPTAGSFDEISYQTVLRAHIAPLLAPAGVA